MFFAYYITRFIAGSNPTSDGEIPVLEHFIDIFLYGILVQEHPR
ncbi:MAG: hypothetical protein NZ840_06340 [Anaerolineales bacterium]|nr:hypothetical protein [Anaerolineales bacterium]MDW8161658.1 hypothetical protein [Anaerolineales bacterium]